MSGCATCGGFGGHHDPVAHGVDMDPAVQWATDRATHSAATGHGSWVSSIENGEPFSECLECGWTTDE